MTIHISGGGKTEIKQYTNTDPSPLTAETLWVKRTIGASVTTSATPIGLLLTLTYADTSAGSVDTYQLSYRTKESTTVRASLS